MRYLLFIWLLAGCRDEAAVPDPAALPNLEPSWTMRRHRDLPTVAWMEGRTAPLALTPAAALRAARAFLLRYPELFALARDDLDDGEADLDELGMIHVRFTQRHDGVPVWGT